MFTVIDGQDFTDAIPFESIRFSGTINDPLGTCEFDVQDTGSQYDLQVEMEVVLHDDNAPPTPTFAGRLIPTIPAHNLLRKAVFLLDTAIWTTSGLLSSTIIRQSTGMTMTFANHPLGTGFLRQVTLVGYVKPGQRYMFSAYETMNTQLTNARMLLRMEFLDQNNIVLATVQDARTPSSIGIETRISIQEVAPPGSVYIRISIGGETLQAGNNSGTLRIATPQLEPMWFTGQGIVYPTPDCNYNQEAAQRMPDDTISRATRVFAGYIEHISIRYGGPNRVLHLICAPAAKVLDNTRLISRVYNATFDDVIINSILNNEFEGRLSGNLIPPNLASPDTILRGVEISAVSYTDMTFREILNSLKDQSGYSYFVSNYYQVFYHPSFYNIATFGFSDTPDGRTTFAYHEYQREVDGSQTKKRIKVIGANPEGPEITNFYPGGSAGVGYVLTHIPARISSLTVNEVAQEVGIFGIHTFDQGFDALVDPPNKVFFFQSTVVPTNILIRYSYQNPIVVTSQKLDHKAITAPEYVIPTFDSKVNDSALTDLRAATIRGLAEITEYGQPRTTLTFKSDVFVPAGYAVYFSKREDNINNQPFLIHSVSGQCLGAGLNIYSYKLGSYNPGIIDLTRNTNKAINRSGAIGNVTTSLQTSIVATEVIAWSERITHT